MIMMIVIYAFSAATSFSSIEPETGIHFIEVLKYIHCDIRCTYATTDTEKFMQVHNF